MAIGAIKIAVAVLEINNPTVEHNKKIKVNTMYGPKDRR